MWWLMEFSRSFKEKQRFLLPEPAIALWTIYHFRTMNDFTFHYTIITVYTQHSPSPSANTQGEGERDLQPCNAAFSFVLYNLVGGSCIDPISDILL